MNEINRYGFLNALINIINTFEEDDSKVVIAKYLLQNFKQINQLNIFEVADECFVTRASIRRFSKYIGLENFRVLKSDPEHYNYYQNTQNIDDYPIFFANQMSKMANDCNNCLQKDLDNILEYIYKSNQIIFLVSDIYSSRCVEFQKGMILSGKMVRIVSYKFTENKLLQSIDEQDLLITISVTGGFATQINKFISTFHCHKALLTTKKDNTLNENYDLTLYLGSNDLPSTKTIYHMFAVEYYLDIIHNEYRNRLN